MLHEAMKEQFEKTEFSWVYGGIGWFQKGSQWIFDDRSELLCEPDTWRIEVKGLQDYTIMDLTDMIQDLKYVVAIDNEYGVGVAVSPALVNIVIKRDPSELVLFGTWTEKDI